MTNARGHGGHCLWLDLGEAPTPRLAAKRVKGEPAGEASLKRILSPRPVSREWDYRTRLSAKEKESWTVEDREWSGKNGETMNAGGVGELE
ncbi:hypothetical protein TNCV_2270651 [Trichonephila clavipes]|nr:hypothetical protein TNCV_2270651 [Trichonephila clavipes]